jgi:membrane protein implicated in regulation of membrane protease activity
MWILLALLILWISSMYFYLPLPVVVLLFAALASAASITIWTALNDRRQRSRHVIEQDTNLQLPRA